MTRRLRTLLVLACTLLTTAGQAADRATVIRGFACRGNEPFWSLSLSDKTALLQRLVGGGTEKRSFSGSRRSFDFLDPPWELWRGTAVDDPGAVLVAAIRAETCLDTMSEEGGTFDHRVLLSLPDSEAVTGCCRAESAVDTAEASNVTPTQPGDRELIGREWVLEDITGRGVIDDARSTLLVAEDGRASGDTACNRFAGAARISDTTIAFGPLASTRRACPPAVMDQEQRYLSALGQVARWRIDERGLLFLEDEAGAPLLRFSAGG